MSINETRLQDEVEIALLRSIIEDKKPCREVAEFVISFIVLRCCEEIESLGGDNVEFHVNGLRQRLLGWASDEGKL